MQLPAPAHFKSSSGVDIYRLSMTLFPNGFVGHAFILDGVGDLTLVDCGSGMGTSNDDLVAGFDEINRRFNRSYKLADIERIIITHAHIDHFGGLAFVKRHTDAVVGIHELDRSVLTNFRERVIGATKALGFFFDHAGVQPALRERLFHMYGFAKRHSGSIKVDINILDEMVIDGMEFIHTPGHCSGLVCIRLGDILLSADHVLSHTTPHQSPESIVHNMGLDHYFDSLRKLRKFDGIRLALGGHEDAIPDLYQRIDDIRDSHMRKLDRVRKILRDNGAPMSISQVTQRMYPDVRDYHILLALEEVGAHIEYLFQHGYLFIANLEEFESESNAAVLCALDE